LSGSIGISNGSDASSAANGGSFTTLGGLAVGKSLWVGTDGNFAGILRSSNTTVSSSGTTGALVLVGGLGISSVANATAPDNGGAFTNYGGMGIGKDLYVGGNIELQGGTLQFKLGGAPIIVMDPTSYNPPSLGTRSIGTRIV